jgi:hypothetical protein
MAFLLLLLLQANEEPENGERHCETTSSTEADLPKDKASTP